MKHEQSARMLISYFNMLTNSKYRVTNRGEEVEQIINDDESNVTEIRKAIKEYVSLGRDASFTNFINWYKYEHKTETEQKVEQVEQKVEAPMSGLETSMKFLADVVANMVAQTKTSEIEGRVAEGLKDKIDAYIFETYGKVERKVNVVTEFGKKELKGILHEKFDTVLKFVANNEPVYLAGPAGSGKNVICKQIAESLGLEFYFTNAVTQEYKLTGFTDANGHYHESQFYKAFTKGGLFMLDEMDASIPEVLIILNAAIANRYFDFPAPIGKVEAHKDFRVVAAGNTYGHGADADYVGRNTLDAASLDRFALIEVDYDERIELGVTDNNKALVAFCENFRKSAKKNGLQITVSYRAMSRMAKMESLIDTVELLKTCLVKGLEKDDIHIVVQGMDDSSKYMDALRKIEQEVK